MGHVEPRFKDPKPRKMRNRRGHVMRDAKLAILERSLGRCEAKFALACTGYGVHAHHVKRRAQGGTNTAENLLWVCAACHTEIHYFPMRARAHGLLAPKGTA